MRILLDRIRALIRRDAVLHDIDDELRSHLEMEADANREVGMSDEDADRAASTGNAADITAFMTQCVEQPRLCP